MAAPDTFQIPYQVEVVRDQVFSLAGGKARLADLYLPQGVTGKLPVILWVHGGGWRFGDRKLCPDLSQSFARCGFAMVSFDYRLSDEVIFPAPVADVKTAVRWVRSIADRYSFDPARIALWGSSAGGHLSAFVAFTAEDQFAGEEYREFSSHVSAVVDGYGPTDFSRMDADRIPAKPAATDAETSIVKLSVPTGHIDSFESRLIGCAVSTSPVEVQQANPINYVRQGAPPFLILHGQSDSAVPWQQSWMLFEALANVGNDVTLVLLEKLNHGFFNNSALDSVDVGSVTTHRSHGGMREPAAVTSSAACFQLVEAFFRKHLQV